MWLIWSLLCFSFQYIIVSLYHDMYWFSKTNHPIDPPVSILFTLDSWQMSYVYPFSTIHDLNIFEHVIYDAVENQTLTFHRIHLATWTIVLWCLWQLLWFHYWTIFSDWLYDFFLSKHSSLLFSSCSYWSSLQVFCSIKFCILFLKYLKKKVRIFQLSRTETLLSLILAKIRIKMYVL